jgi:hypothetical protein
MAFTALIDRFVNECRAAPQLGPGHIEYIEAVLDYTYAVGNHDPVAQAMGDGVFWIISQRGRSLKERLVALGKLADHYGPNPDVRKIVGW